MTRPLPLGLTATLSQLRTYAQSKHITCYLVGGIVRDHVLGRVPLYWNVDITIARGAMAFAREVATQMGGAFVPLDEEAGCARVIVTHDNHRVELDLSDFRGATLEEDLRHRDFTVNAMAVALDDWLAHPGTPTTLIDPLHGRQALNAQQLLACSPGAFEEDPIRIFRAFRFAAQLGFHLDPALPPLMIHAMPRLSAVSGERIRDELLMIFDTDRAYPAIRVLNELGALDVIFPEMVPGRGLEQGGFHHLDVLGHQIETVAQGDRFLADFVEFSPPLREPLAAYCRQQLVERRSRKSLIKLAGLLHDVGKPARRTVEPDGEIWFLGHEQAGAELTTHIVERLHLSNREAEMVCQLVLHHLRPGFLSREPVITRRAIYRFFKELGDNGPGCLLTWWADRMATRGPQSRLDQLDQQRGRLEELLNAYFFQAEEVVKPPRLVDGRQLMDTFRLQPGPLVGELLEAIEEAQAEGQIRSLDDALALAKAQLQTRGTTSA